MRFLQQTHTCLTDFVSPAEAKAESRSHNARTLQGSAPAQEQGKAGELGLQKIRVEIGNAFPICL